jgi:hypothetical protein
MGTRIFWGMAQAFFFTASGNVLDLRAAGGVPGGRGFLPPLAAATAFGACGMLSGGSVMGSGFLTERFGSRQTVSVSFVGTISGMLLLLAMTHFHRCRCWWRSC